MATDIDIRLVIRETGNFTGELAYRVFHFVVQVKNPVGKLVNLIPGRRQIHLVMRSVKQSSIKLFLQLSHLEGYCRLGHVQCLSRFGKTQKLCHGMEYF